MDINQILGPPFFDDLFDAGIFLGYLVVVLVFSAMLLFSAWND